MTRNTSTSHAKSHAILIPLRERHNSGCYCEQQPSCKPTKSRATTATPIFRIAKLVAAMGMLHVPMLIRKAQHLDAGKCRCQ